MNLKQRIEIIEAGLFNNEEGDIVKRSEALNQVMNLIASAEAAQVPDDERYKSVHAAVVRLLTALEADQKDDNFRDTPRRVTEWLLEKFPSEVNQDVQRGLLAKKSFTSPYEGLVAQSSILVYGLCPHHLLPVSYTVALGYLANGRVIGLSKLARLAELELGRAVTQEDGTRNLALTLRRVLKTDDVAVVVKGIHNCMVVRGVKQQSAVTETSEMYGKLRNVDSVKNEFLAVVRNGVK